MNRLISFLILIGVLAVLPGTAGAAQDFYSATAPVVDNSDAQRNKAIRAALEKVLVRLTGVSGIARHPGVPELLANATNYALEFGYVEGENGAGLMVSVSFTRGEIERFLRDRQLPIWPAQRSPLLVWVVKETQGQPPTFVNPEEDQALYSALGSHFADRAMPVRYPLYDLEDMMKLPMQAAWDFNVEQINQASSRYGLAHWLVVRCYESATGEWRVAWMQGGAGESSSQESSSQERSLQESTLESVDKPTLDEALQQMVQVAVDKVAATSSYIPSLAADAIVLEVSGIADYASYRKMINLFSGLSIVRSVSVQSLAADQVSLVLAVEGNQQEFTQALAAYDQLILPPEQPVDGSLSVAWRQPPSFQ